MEEQVGALWHRLITRAADRHHPEAGVTLEEVKRPVATIFRALGGDGGMVIEKAAPCEFYGARTFLQRIAGSGKQVELAWRDERSLRLPSQINLFSDKSLNRDLYIWLTALAVFDESYQSHKTVAWLANQQTLTQNLLTRFPALTPRYQRLVTAHLQQRIAAAKLPHQAAAQERAIRAALLEPGSVATLPSADTLPQPVALWLNPFPPYSQESPPAAEAPEGGQSSSGAFTPQDEDEQSRRYGAERVEKPDARKGGLITIRMENIFSWGDFINLDRGQDESEDLDNAAATAKEMDKLAICRDNRASASNIRFDLDLPAAGSDDAVISEGIMLPEWDYKKLTLQPDYCRLLPMMSLDAIPAPLPPRLRKTARQLRNRFQLLAPSRIWHRGQDEGSDIDLDAYLRYTSERRAGRSTTAAGLYRALHQGGRDLSTLLLADLSLSTDSWVDNQHRVIDIIRDTLYLFSESLMATGDPFAIYGFSSRKRDPIRYHQIKSFKESHNDTIRGRIEAIKPGYYTRLGAAIRHSTSLLCQQSNGRKLLLILTDGKPNDIDRYEGRYGVEDSRHAIHMARQVGVQPFCVTIDTHAKEYLPHIFGSSSYIVIHKPSQLPRELPLLYAQLTAASHSTV
ncbi:MAG: VWA domain-containing protein [Gammaproteobacteria bacterium]|nr:VWA domain-containing protein [Gammaproteobacteria bacterium]